MKFDLIRPCADCPFRSDKKFYLAKGRAREIIDGITREQKTFSCHKTNTSCDDEDGMMRETEKSQHCAGALIMLERMNKPNQMMRIAERLGMYDRTKLDMSSPVYRTPAAMIRGTEGTR